ncbi:MAG: AmmeMemoRadiSam system protein B [Phycisphaeraceae bacterium]
MLQRATHHHSEMETRPPAVAGLFYPDDPRELEAVVGRLLDGAGPAEGPVPKAIIAPHAGYAYCGPVLAAAWARLAPAKGMVKRVVLLGPAHRARFSGVAVPSASRFDTPLGPVPVDRAALHDLLDLPFVHVCDEAHAQEHSLETQLPFLCQALGEPGKEPRPWGVSIVPLAYGQVGSEQLASVLARLWDGPENRIVVSSDLSHFFTYSAAAAMDQRTREAVESIQPWRIGPEQACGYTAIQALLTLAERHHLHPHTLAMQSSGDTTGPREEVVGYGAFSLE